MLESQIYRTKIVHNKLLNSYNHSQVLLAVKQDSRAT